MPTLATVHVPWLWIRLNEYAPSFTNHEIMGRKTFASIVARSPGVSAS